MLNNVLRRSVWGLAVAALILAAHGKADGSWPVWRAYQGAPVVGWGGYTYSYFDADCCWPTCGVVYQPYVVRPITPVRTLLSGIANRWRAHHYTYYWGWGGWGCCDCCCAVCGCAVIDCGCGSVVSPGVIYESPTIVPETGPTPANPPSNPSDELYRPGSESRLAPQSAMLTVRVPQQARIYVNGVETRSTGDLRRYVSRDLAPGYQYTYEVTAEAVVDGQPVTSTKTVQLRAGEQTELAFDLRATKQLETALTVHVPADAQVYLAGNATRGTGPVRTFRTTQLPAGEAWSDYVVRVVVDRNGEQLDREAQITLRAGDRQELTFDFNMDKVASAR